MTNQNEIEKKRALWRSRAETFKEDAKARHADASTAAAASLKSLFLANGGAIVALLTVIGNSSVEVEKVAIWWAFVWFGLGFFAAMLSQWTRFRETGLFTVHARYVAIQLEHPEFTADYADRVVDSETSAKNYRFATHSLFFASSTLFLVGAFTALDAIT